MVEEKVGDPGQLKMPHSLAGSRWLSTAGPGADEGVSVSWQERTDAKEEGPASVERFS